MSAPIYDQMTTQRYDHTQEDHMTLAADIERDYADVKARFEDFEPKITEGLARARALEGNPAADALLLALHVPPVALTIVVDVINGLSRLYEPQKPAAVTVPVVDDQGPAEAAATA